MPRRERLSAHASDVSPIAKHDRLPGLRQHSGARSASLASVQSGDQGRARNVCAYAALAGSLLSTLRAVALADSAGCRVISADLPGHRGRRSDLGARQLQAEVNCFYADDREWQSESP